MTPIKYFFWALILSGDLAVFVALIEYDHGWSKLYNATIAKWFGLKPKTIPPEPNSLAHEVRYFSGWWAIFFGILCVCLGVWWTYLR